jgi:heme exporter protein A
LLSCENIACTRGESLIFSDVGFCLQEGALLLLKGPNGSGKTTLLRILAGLMEPQAGRVLWNDKPITNNYEFRKDLVSIGHRSAVKLDCTVYENLAFWAHIHDTEMLIPAAMKFFDLNALRDVPAGQLSAGWQRRVALARLIVSPCKLWLLDEPTNFLDDDAVILAASLIESRVQQGGIVVVASHIMNSSIAAHTLYINDFNPKLPVVLERKRDPNKRQAAVRVEEPIR